MLHRWGEDGTYVWSPNINGSLTIQQDNIGNIVEGAVTGTYISRSGAGHGSYTGSSRLKVGIDASLSNSIYTTSGHIYPQSLSLNFIIKC